ncbi:DUF6273 domain-containing protein [Synergistaceae bacterium OttesenSCG-928-I11]|nr:DUF6273 domain-containing protein [Synergistaceae bacterium OttesenSCG-928-I11]
MELKEGATSQQLWLCSTHVHSGKAFNSGGTDQAWANSDIKTWLNGEFKTDSGLLPYSGGLLKTYTKFLTTKYVDSAYGAQDLVDADSEIFLLSIEEVNYIYTGNIQAGWNDVNAKPKRADYSNARSAWTRSPVSNKTNNAWYVYNDGQVNSGGVSSAGIAVRPASFLNLESVIFKSGSEVSEPAAEGGKISNPYILYLEKADYAPTSVTKDGTGPKLTIAFANPIAHAYTGSVLSESALANGFTVTTDGSPNTVSSAKVTANGAGVELTLTDTFGNSDPVTINFVHTDGDTDGIGFPGDGKALKSMSYPVTGISATPPTFTASGGNSNVAVTWLDITPASAMVGAFESSATTPAATANVTGSGIATQLAFPANATMTAKTYTIKVSLDNGTTYLDVPTATVTVNGTLPVAPAITGPDSLTLALGYAATSTDVFTATGNPIPTVTKISGDPKITWNDAAKRLEIAAGLEVGTYAVVLSADNGVAPTAAKTFTLTVESGSPTDPTEKAFFTIDATECEIRYVRSADGSMRVEVLIPVAAGSDPSLIATTSATITGMGYTDVSYAFVDENGNETPITTQSAARGAVSAPYLKISFTAPNGSNLDNGVLTKIDYTLKNDAIQYVQTFPDGGMKFADIEKTDTTPGGSSSGVGCDAGMGALALGALAIALIRRRR